MIRISRFAAATTVLLGCTTAVISEKSWAQDAATPTPPTIVVSPDSAAGRPSADASRTRRLVREVRENTENIQSKGEFGSQLWLVQGSQFFEDWRKPETPTIDPVTTVQRGQIISTVVIFYGTARDNKGLCNVDYDVVVKRPDGSIYNRRDAVIGWQDLAPDSSRQLMLGRNYVSVNFSVDDPSGLYTVEAVVRDNVSRQALSLKSSFVLQ